MTGTDDQEVIFPKLDQDMTEGILTKWLVKVGSLVENGAPLAEMESDKVVAEIEAPCYGRVTALAVPEGSSVAVGATIATIQPLAKEVP